MKYMSHDSFTTYFGTHPVIGAITSAISITISYIIGAFPVRHIPPIIMESTQMVVWLVGIVAGSVTIHGWIKINFFKKKKP